MINRNCEQKIQFYFGTREQMLQILLRITEAVMQKPKENQIKDTFAQSMSGLLFRVSIFCVLGTSFSMLIVLLKYYCTVLGNVFVKHEEVLLCSNTTDCFIKKDSRCQKQLI